MSTANDVRFWDGIARKYAAGPIADPQGYDRTLQRTQHYLKRDDAVLEFGCGTGTTALKLAPFVARYVATDISNEMIAIAREKARAEGISTIEFAVANPAEPPWPDESFDAALGFNVLHLIASRQTALRNIHRVLKPGGVFITKTPCLKEVNVLIRFLVPVMQLVGMAPYVASFSAEELEHEIANAGFEIIESARHGSRGKDARPFFVARKI